MPEEKNLFQLVNTAQKILVITKGVLETSDINNLQILTKFLETKKVSFQILCVDKQSDTIQEYSHNIGLDLTYELLPSEYIVTIDYSSSGVEKVVYDTDKENGKLVFKILPSKTGFSFDKVQFQEGSGKFDKTVLIGLDNPKDLGKLYDDNEYLFKESGYVKFLNTEEVVTHFVDSEEVFEQEFVDILVKNVIQNINILEGIPEKNKIELLTKSIDLGGNVSKAIVGKYYSKPDNYLNIYKTIFKNIQTSGEVIYAIVRNSSLDGFIFDDVKNFGRIPFNIINKYKLALILFELSDGKMYLVVESNDPTRFSASTIAGVFDGVGDVGHAYCKVDNMSFEDINNRFWPILKDLYNIEINALSDSKNVDNTPKVLTKRHKHSKLSS